MRKTALESLAGALLLVCPLLSVHADDTPAPESASAIRVLLAAELETTLSSQMSGTLAELPASDTALTLPTVMPEMFTSPPGVIPPASAKNAW